MAITDFIDEHLDAMPLHPDRRLRPVVEEVLMADLNAADELIDNAAAAAHARFRSDPIRYIEHEGFCPEEG